MTIYSDDVRDWLKAGVKPAWPKVTFEVGTEPQKRWGSNSAGLVLVSPTTGPGLINEHAYDQRAWYVQIYGPQTRDSRVNDADVRAERLAVAVDEFIMFGQRPTAIAGVRIPRIQRFGSLATPSALGSGGKQTPWAATYVFDVPTGFAG